MKVAIYHGFDYLHFEMLGYIIEYLLLYKIEFTLYSNINLWSYEWKLFYDKLFNIPWNPTHLFNPDNYEYVFLITDDDSTFKDNGKIKIICIEHIDYIRRLNVYYRIGTRFFVDRPDCDWVIPCYNGISKKNKLEILKKENKINVICIGKSQPYNIETLKNIFCVEEISKINFYLIGREINNIDHFKNYFNIFIYNNCSTLNMLCLLKKSHYILCLDIFDDFHYEKQAISGSIHLGFSFGCTIIIPNDWQVYYNFKSVINYNSKKNNKIKLSKNINLDKLFDERFDLINHRNLIFNKVLLNT